MEGGREDGMVNGKMERKWIGEEVERSGDRDLTRLGRNK